MSFGFGVGDFLATITLANKLRKDFSAAPKQYQAIANELKNFSSVLQDVDTYLASHSISDAQKADILRVLSSCYDVLTELDSTVHKHATLNSTSSTADVKGFVKRSWKRIKWDPEDVRELRARITSNLAFLSASLDQLERDDLAKIISHQKTQIEVQDKLAIRERTKEDEKILDWLATADYIGQHAANVSQRLHDTGQWLLDSEDYKKWASNGVSDRGLYLSGAPGAGKSVLSSMIIDDLRSKYGSADDVQVCYYYCDYKRQAEQILANFLLCLLQQLSARTLLQSVKDLFNEGQNTGAQPGLEAIKNTIHAITKSLKRVFVVIDALDECQSLEGRRKSFLAELLELYRLPGSKVRITITSRHMQDIAILLNDFKAIEVRASDKDIGSYISSQFNLLPKFVGQNPDLQEEIKNSISRQWMESAEHFYRMFWWIFRGSEKFLLAKLHLQAIKGKTTIRQLRNSLKSMTTSGYSEAYTNSMNRICGQIEDQKELAITALMWIVYAERSLISSELLHALATEIDSPVLHEDNIPYMEDVLSSCCGLVILEPESSIVRLVHRTTEQFFKEHGSTWLSGAQTKLSRVCSTYLAFEALTHCKSGPAEAFEEKLVQYPFYNYASWHWGDHAKAQDNAMTLDEFVSKQKQIDLSVDTLMSSMIPEYFERCRQHPDIRGLHLLSYCGMTALIPKFIERYDINERDRHGQTPLSYAIWGEQKDAMHLLVKSGARLDELLVHPRLNCKARPVPLLWHAIQRGDRETMEFLIENGADVDAVDQSKRNSLHFLIECLCETKSVKDFQFAKLLLSAGASVCHQDEDGRTPLSLLVDVKYWIEPVYREQRAMVYQLLQHGSDPHQADQYGFTPCYYTVGRNPNLFLDLLFYPVIVDPEAGVLPSLSVETVTKLDKQNTNGFTLLMHAIKRWQRESITFLINNGVNVNLESKEKRSALTYAVRQYSNLETIQNLIRKGAIIDQTDENGETPLFYAVRNDYSYIARELLIAGASTSRVNAKGNTLWSYLDRPEMYGGYAFNFTDRQLIDCEKAQRIISAMLRYGADLDVIDAKGWTPIFHVEECPHCAVSDSGHRLTERSDLNFSDKEDKTPLFYAAARGLIASVEILLRAGANVNYRSRTGETPIMCALGHEMKNFLISKGAEPGESYVTED